MWNGKMYICKNVRKTIFNSKPGLKIFISSRIFCLQTVVHKQDYYSPSHLTHWTTTVRHILNDKTLNISVTLLQPEKKLK